jgi:hypothetical protein
LVKSRESKPTSRTIKSSLREGLYSEHFVSTVPHLHPSAPVLTS